MKRFFRSRAETAEDDSSQRLASRGFGDGVPPPERPARGQRVLDDDESLAGYDLDDYTADEGAPAGYDPDTLAGDTVVPDRLGPAGYEPDDLDPADEYGGEDADFHLDSALDSALDSDMGIEPSSEPVHDDGSLRGRLGSSRARARVEASGEQRSAWAYLGLLSGLFGFLVVFGYACSDARPSDVAATDPAAEMVSGATPSRLVFRVDGDVVAVQGDVPDQAARDQLLAAAGAVYGAENVVDDITIDEGTTLESGTVRFVGSSVFGDERPEALQESVAATFGLANRGFEVGFAETVRGPVNAEAMLDGARVVLSGVLPDDQSVTDLQAAAGEIWGPENVDGTGLITGDSTWTDGVVRLTGSTVPTDDRPARFGDLVKERIDALVVIDTSGLAIVDNSAQLAEVQATVDDLVAGSPIQFAPDSPVISEESEAVLTELAASLNQIPDVAFEVVGHTDDVGEEQDNLILSQERAEAVVARLAELGVDPGRMSSRGEGEANPIADNDTDEGKAANRRIEFILVGTSTE